MADKSFHVEIVTPERMVFKGEAISFTAPGVEGGFQVLFNHAPLLSALKIGEIKVTDINGSETHYATSGGFVEVRENTVLLLAETAERIDEIDAERAKSSRDRAHQRLAEKSGNIDYERAKLSLYRALNRLKLAGASA